MTTKIKRNHFYGHSISVRYASPAHVKKGRNKIVISFLTCGCIEIQNDSRLSFILEETLLNCAYCHKMSKRLHNLRTDGIRSKQVGMSSSDEIMATSYVKAEQRTVIQFCFDSGMTPLDTLN